MKLITFRQTHRSAMRLAPMCVGRGLFHNPEPPRILRNAADLESTASMCGRSWPSSPDYFPLAHLQMRPSRYRKVRGVL